ncbi:type VI secretion system protein TssA [Arenibaculum pallidiluteum]|uniref:type VI secretion system protein TssA n=1 Tax=Arenibaculum pallidiluteum TaxID=2812559 RepID=UPI001A9798F3|nr:type VI secretion system protein TssA [Arenibaculum pallidiluteum]
MVSELPESVYREVGLDLAALLAPLPEGEGAGEDIRYAPEMDALAEARRTEDETEQGVWQTSFKKADWRAVVRMSADLLETRSKDLQVAVWLVQALARQHGLKGLAVGVDLVTRLTEAFWPSLWPRPDEDDLEPRLGPYFWMDAHLKSEVLQAVVTEPPPNERQGLDFQGIIRSRKLRHLASNNPRAYQQALSEGERSPEDADAAFAQTSDRFVQDRRDEVRLALAAARRLCAALDATAGRQAPSLSEFLGVLQDVERFLGQAAAERGLDRRPDPDPEPASDNEEEDMPARVNPPRFQIAAGMPAISNRRAAYALLDYAADWLLENEPHSPAPYLVKRAVSWEDRSLREVLGELMAKGADPSAIFEVLGMNEEDGRPARRRRATALADD